MPLAFLSNLAGPDGFMIMFFVLIFFGAKRLPELARSLGTAVKEFNHAKEQFTRELISPLPAVVVVPQQEAVPSSPVPAASATATPAVAANGDTTSSATSS